MSNEKERALLIFLPAEGSQPDLIARRQAEMLALADSAGLEVVDTLSQKLRGDQRQLGKGKAQEAAAYMAAADIDVAVFDRDLTPSQTRAMEKALDRKVIDRATLILDIFAQRARTREGRVQVEGAQLARLLPRLTGQGTALSRLGGGIGTRGPGETQLETDRRHIRRRLAQVQRDLKKVSAERQVQRAAREAQPHPFVVIVGYTNAGKSTFLNALTGSDIYAEDRLFATLDPTTRRVSSPLGELYFMADTVGFMEDLPPELTIAFKATLEIVKEADVLIHLFNVADEGYEDRIRVVNHFLRDLGGEGIPMLYVANQADQLDESPYLGGFFKDEPVVALSAKTGQGFDAFWQALRPLAEKSLFAQPVRLPNSAEGARLLALAHESGEVSQLSATEAGISFYLRGDRDRLAGPFGPYIKGPEDDQD
ncbi:GTPase HflX [Peptococcus simiae]|uniref:GTPase HflX n=1 Tax=Peptococcus simiae TaxID=1643805 RepID=UPI00397FC782